MLEPRTAEEHIVAERLKRLSACLAGEFLSLHDQVNQSVGRDLLLSNGGLPPRVTPPKPPTLSCDEERAMQEAMETFRNKDF
jgi:hypothetical protein